VPQKTALIDTKTIFDSLHYPYIVFAADEDFTIMEENQAHAKIAKVSREDVVGKPLLEAFPDTSEEYIKTGRSNLIESIQSVIKTGKPDSMPNLRYDLRDETGSYESRFWSISHHPIKNTKGTVIAVYQATEDITDRAIVDAQLDRAQHQLEHVLASSLVGTWHWDIKKQLVTTDSNLAHMFGIKPERAKKGLPLDQFIASIHEDDRERVKNSIASAVGQEMSFEEEYRTTDINGEVRWVIARGQVEYNSQKEPVSFTGIIIDISDRKHAEKLSSDNDVRLQFMADAMPQLVWISRSDGYHEYYNRQWYEFTGTEPGQTDGETWNDLFHPDDRKRAIKLWRKSLKTGEPYEIEYRLYHAPSKSYRWVIGRALPFRNDEGGIVKWYGTCTDVHEQKHATEIARFLADVSKQLASSLDYKLMLKQVTDLCVPVVADWSSIDLYTKEKGFEQVSVAHTDPQKISQALEYRKHNPVHIDDPTGLPNVIRTGKSEFYPLITDEMLEQFIEDEERLVFMKSLQLRSIIIAPLKIKDEIIGGISFILSESGRCYTESDLGMVEELAARISLSLTNSRLYVDSQEEVKRRTRLEKELLIEQQKLESRVKERTNQLQLTNQGLREEIRKRHAVEEELQAYSEDLARSNSELEDFAYVASHDLQEPLRKIQAFSNLLQSEYSEQLGDGSDYVDRMHAAAERMSTLIQDLLAFSRVATQAAEPTKVDLNQIAKDVLFDLETRIVDVQGIVKIGKLPVLKADQTQMRQLFQNLIGNALKFHKPDVPSRVKVSRRSVGKEWIEIRFEDNGIGFDEKYIDKIFAVFQRLHGREAYDGTGIGLAVCRKIVEQYGGTITAESKKNEGATFIVRLPKTKEV
jgi:PAS domain S-box-containing protein